MSSDSRQSAKESLEVCNLVIWMALRVQGSIVRSRLGDRGNRSDDGL